MASIAGIRTVLLSAELQPGRTGYHRLRFRIGGGRSETADVTVQISEDAYRKVTGQLARARFHPEEKRSFLKRWAQWEITRRLLEDGALPSTITVAAHDVDDLGAYALDLGYSLLGRGR